MSEELFQPVSTRENAIQNAVVGGEWKSRHSYIYGYYLAARELVKSALGNEPQDFLFYPICFNYRHYLELHLKGLVHSLERFYLKLEEYGRPEGEVEEMKRDELDHKHSLESLTQIFEKCLEAVSGKPLDTDVRSIIIELHNFDTGGQTFRYHRNTDGEPTIPEQKHIDLNRLAEEMEEVHKHLVGIDGWLDHEKSQLEEMIEIHRSDMPDFP